MLFRIFQQLSHLGVSIDWLSFLFQVWFSWFLVEQDFLLMWFKKKIHILDILATMLCDFGF